MITRDKTLNIMDEVVFVSLKFCLRFPLLQITHAMNVTEMFCAATHTHNMLVVNKIFVTASTCDKQNFHATLMNKN